MSGVAGPSRTLSAADVLHAQLGVWYMQAPYAESDDAACAEVGVCLWLARLVAGVEPPPRSYAEYLHLLHAALDGNCAFTNDGRRGREAHVHSVSDWLAAQVRRMESKPNGVVLLLQGASQCCAMQGFAAHRANSRPAGHLPARAEQSAHAGRAAAHRPPLHAGHLPAPRAPRRHASRRGRHGTAVRRDGRLHRRHWS